MWVSIDAGGSWTRLKGNLPTVPVHDFTVHPREQDLVLGTYGRGVFVGDITHLQALTPEVLTRPLHVFPVEPRPRYGFRALGNYHLFGHKYIEVPNEPDALVINYFLSESQEESARLTVANAQGETITRLEGPARAGLNRGLWHMRADPAPGVGGRAGRTRARGAAAAAGRVPDHRRSRRRAPDGHRPDPDADRATMSDMGACA